MKSHRNAAGDAVSSGSWPTGVNYGHCVQCRQAPCGVAGETLPLAYKWENLPEFTMVRFLLFVEATGF
jgi:hypothetical protein